MVALDRAVTSSTKISTPESLGDISRLIQAAQVAYEEATASEKKPSKWAENIQNKLEKMKAKAGILVKKREQQPLDTSEVKEARRVMRRAKTLLKQTSRCSRSHRKAGRRY